MEDLAELGLRCNREHKHVHLKGTERVRIGGISATRNRTVGAGAYPADLCTAWASILKRVCPKRGLGGVGWVEQNDFKLALSEAVSSGGGQTKKAATIDYRWHDPEKREQFNLQRASNFIQNNPVIFGQFTKEQIEQEQRRFDSAEKANEASPGPQRTQVAC